MSDPAEFRAHISPGQRRKQHVAQACKGDGNQHDFTGKDVQDRKNLIAEPLVIGQKTGDKGSCHNCQDDIIGNRSDILHLRGFEPANQKKNTAADDDRR